MKIHLKLEFSAIASLILIGGPAFGEEVKSVCTVPKSHYETFLQKGLFYKEPNGQIYYQVYGAISTKWIIHSYQNPCFSKYGIALYPEPN